MRIKQLTAIHRWECEEVNNKSNNISWDEQFTSLKKLYIEPRMKSFHYLLINKRITTKKDRCRFKIVDDPFCHLCKLEESFDHLFLECTHTLRLWERLKQKLNKITISNW